MTVRITGITSEQSSRSGVRCYIPKSEVKTVVGCIQFEEGNHRKRQSERAQVIIPKVEGNFGDEWVQDTIGTQIKHLLRKDGDQYIPVCVEKLARWIESLYVISGRQRLRMLSIVVKLRNLTSIILVLMTELVL